MIDFRSFQYYGSGVEAKIHSSVLGKTDYSFLSTGYQADVLIDIIEVTTLLARDNEGKTQLKSNFAFPNIEGVTAMVASHEDGISQYTVKGNSFETSLKSSLANTSINANATGIEAIGGTRPDDCSNNFTKATIKTLTNGQSKVSFKTYSCSSESAISEVSTSNDYFPQGSTIKLFEENGVDKVSIEFALDKSIRF